MKIKFFLHTGMCLFLLILIPACNFPVPSTSAPMPAQETTALLQESTSTEKTSILLRLTLVTGDDGTVDIPHFVLSDQNNIPLFTIDLDQMGDLQPGQTVVYEFTVPASFCTATGWMLTKPPTAGVDDPWLLSELDIEIDGDLVYFDRGLSSWGTITAESQLSGNWSSIELFQQRCGD